MNKQLKQSVTVLLLGCLIALLFIGAVWAGGVINHKVTVKNSADEDVQVCLCYSIACNCVYNNIARGSSYTFETGSSCPLGLSGWATSQDLVTRCTLGLEKGQGAVVCTHCIGITCESSNWEIKKQSDGKYHFEKN